MIYYLFFLLSFVNIVSSLRCKTASPPNCIYNSTCIYDTTECIKSSTSSSVRGGTYCMTLITKIDEIVIAKMDCMYDQETIKPCKNQSECQMKYTNDLKQFLHCCCDQDFCNLNFTLSDIDRKTIPIDSKNDCKGLLCKPIYLIISCSAIGLIILIIISSFFYRKNLFEAFEKCKNYINKSPPNEPIVQQKEPLLKLDDQQIDQFIHFDQLIIEDLVKRGRFSTIHRGIYQKQRVAIKILSFNTQNDEPQMLFEREKEIYSLQYMNHINILKYYGYSKCNDKLCLITELSENGSLRDILRSRLLIDENELILILKDISSGVEYLHKEFRNGNEIIRPSIAHRDLKSDNILYLNSNRLVICDFAMSTQIKQNQNGPNQEQQLGTPRYMPPEILAGTIGSEKEALLKCDVYALGIIFWEVLSRYPFEDLNDVYIQPFETQLNENNLNKTNPTVNDMLKIMLLPVPLNRPLINPLWRNLNKSCINSIISIMDACWCQDPDGRISSATVLHRIQKLTN